MSYLLVFVGGGLGAVLRFVLSNWAIHFGKIALWGTLSANVLACLLLGYLTFQGLDSGSSPNTKLILATGFCGGFSTFSTFSLEAYHLFETGKPSLALGYIALSVILGLASIAVFALR